MHRICRNFSFFLFALYFVYSISIISIYSVYCILFITKIKLGIIGRNLIVLLKIGRNVS